MFAYYTPSFQGIWNGNIGQKLVNIEYIQHIEFIVIINLEFVFT